MTRNFYRQKLINAILFFARETERLNITKLSKLLHYFDFRHFAQTGYPAIGLQYFTYPKGPVPEKFWREVKDGIPPEDFSDAIAITVKRDFKDPTWREVEFKAKANPDLSVFTPREQRILREVAEIFKGVTGSLISEASHQEGDPWDITIREKGMYQPIDYILGLDERFPVSREEAEENLREYFSILKAFEIEPSK